MVNEKDLTRKYHAILNHVFEAVIYRDAWYRSNGLDALKLIVFASITDVVKAMQRISVEFCRELGIDLFLFYSILTAKQKQNTVLFCSTYPVT
jgi:hypothetical protein